MVEISISPRLVVFVLYISRIHHHDHHISNMISIRNPSPSTTCFDISKGVTCTRRTFRVSFGPYHRHSTPVHTYLGSFQLPPKQLTTMASASQIDDWFRLRQSNTLQQIPFCNLPMSTSAIPLPFSRSRLKAKKGLRGIKMLYRHDVTSPVQ